MKVQICKICNSKMVGVMSFSKDKQEKYCRCSYCYSESKHRKMDEKELTFGEVLHKAMNNRK